LSDGRATVEVAGDGYIEADDVAAAAERERIRHDRTVPHQDSAEFLSAVWPALSKLRQHPFYEFVCALLTALGVPARPSRHGDTSLRMDAVCPHAEASMPIEIKSPTETPCADLKSVRQALENAVIMRARRTDPTTPETPSLAVGFTRVPDRSDARELADDIEATYGIRIKLLSTRRLVQILASTATRSATFDPEALRSGEFTG
jgi:hypothetical protein